MMNFWWDSSNDDERLSDDASSDDDFDRGMTLTLRMTRLVG